MFVSFWKFIEFHKILIDNSNSQNINENPHPDRICETCLNDLRVAFDFNQRCANAFEQLIELLEDKQSFGDPIEFASGGEISPIAEDETSIETKLIDENETIDVNIHHLKWVDTDFYWLNCLYSCYQCFRSQTKHEIDQNERFFETNIENEETDEDDKPLKSIIKSSKRDSKHEVGKKKRQSTNIKKEKTDGNDKPLGSKIKSFQCDICDSSFTRHTHLRRHMTIHSDQRAYACQQCDKRFRRPDHLKIHENYHAQIKPFICEQCQKTFSRAEHLKRHIRNLHTQKIVVVLQCSECEFTARSAKTLAIHRKIHNIVTFMCKFCDQEFSTKLELSEHTKCHNDEKPFLCSECGMRFIRNDYLVVHMRRHKGERPYQCRYCSRAFPRATDLKIHEKYHTNEKTHVNLVDFNDFWHY